MGVRILYDSENDQACFFCSTSDVAFGPVFYTGVDREAEMHGADDRAKAFLRWFETCDVKKYMPSGWFLGGRRDVRQLQDADLIIAYGDWSSQEAAQWANEEAAEAAGDNEVTR